MKPIPLSGRPLVLLGDHGQASAQHGFLSNDFDRIDFILESPPGKHRFSIDHGPMPFDYRPPSNPRVLGTAAVAAITFFYGCGGPLGSEDIVAMGGPLTAMVVLSVYPLVFTIPYGAVVAELCSAFPEDGGFTIWVTSAFGAFWGMQIGYWSWVAGVFSGAIYPAYLLELTTSYAGVDISSSGVTHLLKTSIGLLLALPTFLSTRAIGRGAVGFLSLVYVPLVIYIVWCCAKYKDDSQLSIVSHANTTEGHWEDDTQRSLGIENSYYDVLNAVFWNYDGIQMASVFGGQVSNPARVYSRAISITLTVTILAYVMPIPATLVARAVNWDNFSRGVYVDGALAVGGRFLRVIMIISTITTNVGLYMSSLFCKSFEMAGMADSRLLPPVFAHRTKLFGSPHFSVLVTVLATVALANVDTFSLLPVANVFAALVTMTIFASAIQLRRTLPFMQRPTTVPGGLWCLIVLALIPGAICTYLIIKNVLLGWREALMIGGFFALGLIYGGVKAWS